MSEFYVIVIVIIIIDCSYFATKPGFMQDVCITLPSLRNVQILAHVSGWSQGPIIRFSLTVVLVGNIRNPLFIFSSSDMSWAYK